MGPRNIFSSIQREKDELEVQVAQEQHKPFKVILACIVNEIMTIQRA